MMSMQLTHELITLKVFILSFFSLSLSVEFFLSILSEEENSESKDKKSLSLFSFLSFSKSDETLRISELSALLSS